MKQRGPQIWIVIATSLSLGSLAFSDHIQAHQLMNSLDLGYDVFGRNAFLLTLNAMGLSFSILFPIAFLFLLLGLVSALLLDRLKNQKILNAFFQSIIDALASFPGLLIGIGVSALGTTGAISLVIASATLVLPNLIRFFESQISHLKSQPFVSAAIAVGLSPVQIAWRHFSPDLLDQARAIAPFILSRILFLETTLAFLGIGPIGNIETWGRLLEQSRDYLLEAPWLLFIVGSPLFFTLVSFHLLTQRWNR